MINESIKSKAERVDRILQKSRAFVPHYVHTRLGADLYRCAEYRTGAYVVYELRVSRRTGEYHDHVFVADCKLQTQESADEIFNERMAEYHADREAAVAAGRAANAARWAAFRASLKCK